MIEALLALEFGQGGNAETHLGFGWSTGEDGFRWMVGDASDLWLENPGTASDFLLELDLRPFVRPPELTTQRFALLVRGVQVGRADLDKGGVFAWHVPRALLAAPGPVRLTLLHPDARRPSELSESTDARPLAVSVHSARVLRIDVPALSRPTAPPEPVAWRSWATGLPVADDNTPRDAPTEMPAGDLVMHFESLGDNCEFGLVQRRCGKEPLGLLRFSNIMLPFLLRGMTSGFAGAGDLDTLELWDGADGKEYVIRDTSYGITYHTFLYKDQVAADGLLARQSARLKFLARKLIDDVAAAEKIFVFKRNDAVSEAEILPLYAAMRARGESTLLWVVPADDEHPPGRVERVLPGLLRGWIERFAPYENAHDLPLPAWLELCRQAYNLATGNHVGSVLTAQVVEPATTEA
ncbi:MAG TPA: hypothetical protein VGG99_24270 [Acetobacteraceae bacterium]